MRSKVSFVIVVILVGGNLLTPLHAQDKELKKYVEGRTERSFTLYASTLRMINIKKNQTFYDIVNDIEKVNVFILDSSVLKDRSYEAIAESYSKLGFEEYATAYGGNSYLYFAGKKNGKGLNLVGTIRQNDNAYAFYLTGQIPFEKLPSFIQAVREDDLFSLLPIN